MPDIVAEPDAYAKTMVFHEYPAITHSSDHGTIMQPRILIADDSFETQQLIMRSLVTFNAEFDNAMNGFEALNKIIAAQKNGSPYDLLITDINMPLLRGDELISKLRSDENKIPVLVITAEGDKSLLMTLLKNGVTEYLDKPYHPADLRNSVSNILSQAQHRDEIARRAEEQQRQLHLMSHELSQYEEHFAKIRQQVQFAIATYRSLTLIKNDIPGLTYSLKTRPFHDLGGDFCAINQTPSGYDFFMADVAGHDIGASYLAVMMKAYFEENRNLLKCGEDFFLALNRALVENGAGRMVCAVYISIDLFHLTATISSAAHPTPVFVKAHPAHTASVESSGTPLGFNAPLEFDSKVLQIENGDRFFIFTDGLTALKKIDGATGRTQLLGEQQLCSLIDSNKDAPLDTLTDTVWNEALAFSRQKINDDIMLVGLEIPGGNNV